MNRNYVTKECLQSITVFHKMQRHIHYFAFGTVIKWGPVGGELYNGLNCHITKLGLYYTCCNLTVKFVDCKIRTKQLIVAALQKINVRF